MALALLAWALALLRWFHLSVVEPCVRWWEDTVLALWEEWVVALVRQTFEEVLRFLNGVASTALAVVNPRHRDGLRQSWRREEEKWQQWWKEVQARPSTLNALVASLAQQQQEQQQAAGEAGERSGTNQAPGQAQQQQPNAPGTSSAHAGSGEARHRSQGPRTRGWAVAAHSVHCISETAVVMDAWAERRGPGVQAARRVRGGHWGRGHQRCCRPITRHAADPFCHCTA